MTTESFRVDVDGVAIYVRSEAEMRHLSFFAHKMAIAKIALHKIAASKTVNAARTAARAIEDMRDV